MNVSLSFAEQETTIYMGHDSETARIYTSDRAMISRLDKLCTALPDTYRCVWVDKVTDANGIPLGKKYEVGKKYVRFGKPAKREPMSEEMRSAKRDLMKKMNAQRARQNDEL